MSYGFEQGDRVAARRGGPRIPSLNIKTGERARFHFLTSGNPDDPFMMSGLFHQIPDGEFTRRVICLRDMTSGADVCQYCETGDRAESKQFAMWTLAHHILHTSDNPDEQGEGWREVKVPLEAAPGDVEQRKRSMFLEEVEKPLLLWLSYGRGDSRYKQFRAAYFKFGSLLTAQYQIRRTGATWQETEYTLSVVKEEALPKKTFQEATERLQTVEEIFRQTAGELPRPVASMAAPEEIALDSDKLPFGDEPAPADEIEELSGTVEELV